jgi:tetratricopeptide (TPR) repeat protein
MKANLERSQTNNESAYEELVTVIEASKETLALLIAVCDHPKLRESVIQQYEQDLKPEFQSYRLQLAKQEPSLRAALAKWSEQHQPVPSAVLTVTGAEDLLWFKPKEDDKARTEVEKFFGYLQWGREGLREFACPIVLWVPQRILKELSLKAPDFWSWRKGVFRFTSEQLTEPSALAHDRLISVSAPETDSFLLPLEDLQELIAATEQQQGADAPLLSTLYSRLAQVYQSRVERGEAKNLQEERDLAVEYYQKAIALQTKLKQDAALAQTLLNLGFFYYSQANYWGAISPSQQSLQLFQKNGDLMGKASSVNNLGVAYYSLGQYQQAFEFFEQALAIFHEVGDRNGEAGSLGNLGNIYRSLGQYQQAVEFYEQSLIILKEIGDRNGEAIFLQNLGIVYRLLGQYSLALEFYNQSLVLKRELGDRNGEANSLGSLGNVYRSLGKYQQALEFYEQCLIICHEIGDRKGEATTEFNLGNTFTKLDRVPDALRAYENARQLYTDMGLEAEVHDCDNAIQELSSVLNHPA